MLAATSTAIAAVQKGSWDGADKATVAPHSRACAPTESGANFPEHKGHGGITGGGMANGSSAPNSYGYPVRTSFIVSNSGARESYVSGWPTSTSELHELLVCVCEGGGFRGALPP